MFRLVTNIMALRTAGLIIVRTCAFCYVLLLIYTPLYYKMNREDSRLKKQKTRFASRLSANAYILGAEYEYTDNSRLLYLMGGDWSTTGRAKRARRSLSG